MFNSNKEAAKIEKATDGLARMHKSAIVNAIVIEVYELNESRYKLVRYELEANRDIKADSVYTAVVHKDKYNKSIEADCYDRLRNFHQLDALFHGAF